MVLTADPVLQRIIAVVVERIDPERIILFGSRARGDARQDSDYDLLIVEAARSADRRGTLAALYRALVGTATGAVDLLLHSGAEVERWRGSRAHVLGWASADGQVVYERG